MKNTKLACLCAICLCITGSFLLSACGQAPSSVSQPADEEREQAVDEETERPVNEEAQQPVDEETEQPVNEEAQQPEYGETEQAVSEGMQQPVDEETEQDVSEETEQVDKPQAQELTQEEIVFFSDYLTSSGNIGFLLSTYESADEIDLNELFYSGAGISNWSLTEEEAQDYLKASGDIEIYTDVVHLTTTEIDDFLLEKTGLTSAQMKKGLDWVYSAETDTWYQQAGDTNWRPFECIGGTVDGDVYTLYMQAQDYWAETHEIYETVLRKNGDGYQFVSNLLVEEASAQPESISDSIQEYTDFGEVQIDIRLPIEGQYYYDIENVVLYLELYDELPPNYITKNEARELGWEGGSVEPYLDGAAIGGDRFGNREGLLPASDGRSYTECDIDTDGCGSRGAKRLVFSNDGLYFYTVDHYETFAEVTVTDEYEVIW